MTTASSVSSLDTTLQSMQHSVREPIAFRLMPVGHRGLVFPGSRAEHGIPLYHLE